MDLPTQRGAARMASLLVPILALGGCSEPGPAWDGTVRDSTGIQVVVNRGQPLDDTAAEWTEAVKIGAADGPAEYRFGALGDMAMLSDGRIAVLDGMNRNLRFFFPDGRWDTTVGGPGAGPEEFGARGLSMVVGPGDTLLVLDPGNQRGHVIDASGDWADGWSYVPGDQWMARDWHSSPGGRIVSHMSRVPGTGGPGDIVDVVLERGLHGAVHDTAGTVPGSRLRRRIGRGFEFYLYAGEPATALCPDNTLIAGRGDRYRIVRYDTAGIPIQVVRLEREPVPITEDEKTFLRTRFRKIYLENGFTPERVARLLAGMHFTETYPAFVTLTCGPRSSVWVMPVRPVRDLSAEEKEDFWVGPSPEAAPRFDVFGRDGRYLGPVALPDGFWPRSFERGLLLGRWRDSLDVEYVKALEAEGLEDR